VVSDRGFDRESLARFAEAGFVVARGLLPAAVRWRMLAAAERDLAAAVPPLEYEAELRYPGAPPSLEAPGGRTVRRLLQACDRDPVFREAATAPAIADRLRQLLGPRLALARAHHNCVMTKHPQYGSQTLWHRDIRYWSYRRPELVSVWFALGEEHAGNGGLMLLPGTQRLDFAPERLDAAQFLRTDLAQNRALLESKVDVELAPGDLLFFHCRLFHAAGTNRSDRIKFSPVFTYRALDNPPLPGSRSASLPDVYL
jgi:phytanoyl-CoA hydroxylase